MSVLSERFYIMEQKQRRQEREQEQRKKEIKAIQQKKAQEKEFKEYEKGLFLACKKELKQKFEEEFRLQGVKAKYHFYKIENRDILIKSIAKSELEGDYLETNYNKFLNETIRKYELHKQYQDERNKEIAQEYVEKMTPIWEEERKKQKIKNISNNILFSVFKIFEHPFILLSLIILGVLVSMFMGALELGFFKALGLSIITFIVLIGIFFRIYKIKKEVEKLLFFAFLPLFYFSCISILKALFFYNILIRGLFFDLLKSIFSFRV